MRCVSTQPEGFRLTPNISLTYVGTADILYKSGPAKRVWSRRKLEILPPGLFSNAFCLIDLGGETSENETYNSVRGGPDVPHANLAGDGGKYWS